MSQLSYTAITSSGDAYDIHFPLHPETRSAETVSGILTRTLAAVATEVDTQTATGDAVSDGDIIQSLAMALAVRARLVDAPPAVSLRLMHGLVDQAFAATLDATRYRTGRA
jgi:hypothetical protein